MRICGCANGEHLNLQQYIENKKARDYPGFKDFLVFQKDLEVDLGFGLKKGFDILSSILDRANVTSSFCYLPDRC